VADGLLDMLLGGAVPPAPVRPLLAQQADPLIYDPEIHGPPTTHFGETSQGRDQAGVIHPLPDTRYQQVTPNGEQTGQWDFITGEGAPRYPGTQRPRIWLPDTKMWRRIIDRPSA
jgi:hypothetical protein